MSRLAFTLASLFALRVLGASALESSRAESAQAHAQVEAFSREQAVLRAELDTLSGQIEALKARRQRTAGAELDAELRRSQVLSDRLAALARAVADAKDAAQRSDTALLAAINAELEAEQGAWSAADRPARQTLIAQMRALRAEREAVRARLPEAALPSLAPSRTDDPTALLERADALRDSEDKVRRQLAELDARITEAKSERDLDQRMNELSGDESMFDEQDRQLRLTRSGDGALKLDAPGQTSRTVDTGTSSPPPNAAPASAPQPPGISPPPQLASETHASDHQPQLGQPTSPSAPADDLASLERERARLAQLAQTLEAQAQAAEQQARGNP